MEKKDFCDMSYAKKNKSLCIYCSYREAVPSKNRLFCTVKTSVLKIAKITPKNA